MKDFPQRQKDAQQGRRKEGPWSEKDYIYYVQHTTITTHHHYRRYTLRLTTCSCAVVGDPLQLHALLVEGLDLIVQLRA